MEVADLSTIINTCEKWQARDNLRLNKTKISAEEIEFRRALPVVSWTLKLKRLHFRS